MIFSRQLCRAGYQVVVVGKLTGWKNARRKWTGPDRRKRELRHDPYIYSRVRGALTINNIPEVPGITGMKPGTTAAAAAAVVQEPGI